MAKVDKILDFLQQKTENKCRLLRTQHSVTFLNMKGGGRKSYGNQGFRRDVQVSQQPSQQTQQSRRLDGCGVQIVLRLYQHPAEVLLGFDIGASCL